MKKFLKSFLVIMVAVCVALPLVACKKKVSPTSTDLSKVKSVNGVSTNGGITAIYGDYLYFINGTKTNDGTSQNKNTRSAICRVKYNETTGETSGDMEIVVDELVGFANGSLYFFGDYMYYATPCSDKNSSASVLYNKTCFKRYDLVNKKSYTIYTTANNSSSVTVSYAYYISGETLNLLVYESLSSDGTIKSLKVDKKVTENYTISDVASCLFSENYGKVTTSGATVDANSFVFYTKDPVEGEAVQTGNKVYKTSPVEDNSTCIYSDGSDIELKTIRAGKLVYAYDDVIYAQSITNKTNEKLVVNFQYAIYHGSSENVIYLENYKLTGEQTSAKLEKSEGDIVIIGFNETGKEISLSQWSTESGHDINFTAVTTFTDEVSSFEFIGTAILEEVVTEDDKDTDENEEVKAKFLYVLYKNSSTLYKAKLAKLNDDGTMNLDIYNSCVKLSGSTLSDTTGILVPEVIGNYLFIMAQDDDKNNYLIKVDLTAKETVSDKSDFFAMIEPVEEAEDDEE